MLTINQNNYQPKSPKIQQLVSKSMFNSGKVSLQSINRYNFDMLSQKEEEIPEIKL